MLPCKKTNFIKVVIAVHDYLLVEFSVLLLKIVTEAMFSG